MYHLEYLRELLLHEGVDLIYEEALPSTNLYLKEHRSEARTVCLCGVQTAGYGRNARSWIPCGITVSYRREIGEDRPYSLYCGLAAVRALTETLNCESQTPVLLKWPNDVVCGGKKLAGILCEGYYSSGKRYMIFGIGLNTQGTAELFEKQGVPHATSLENEKMLLSSPEAWIASWVRYLNPMIEQESVAFLEEYRKICVTLGKEILIASDAGSVRDTAVSVDSRGNLVCASGRVVRAADVSVRGIYGYV